MAIRLPGVIVRIVPDIGRVALPLFPRYVCIIAQGEHRLLRKNEIVLRTSGQNFDNLSYTPVQEILLVGNVPDASDYRINDHYILHGTDGIEWKPLQPSELLGLNPEPFDLSSANKIYLSVDFRNYIEISITGLNQNAVTAAEVVEDINNALANSPDYGPAYSSVASVVTQGGQNFVKLTSVATGEDNGIIRLKGGTSDCSEIIFGDLDGDGDLNGLVSVYEVRGRGRRPADGSFYYVTYRYLAGDTTYEPQLYFDLEPLMQEHGGLYLASTPQKLNPLVAMAKLVFQDQPERVPGVVVIQLDLRRESDPYNPSSFGLRQAFMNAIQKLERVTYGKLYLVPDTTDPDIINEFFNHVKRMSDPEIKAERMLITSLPPGSRVQDYIGPNGAARFFNSRVMLFYPPEVEVKIDFSSFRVSGYYAGLVYAARKTALPVGTPINMEPLVNVSISTPPTYNEKKALLGAGVATLDIYRGNTVILHGITTRTDYVIFEEENIVDIADYVKAIWREKLEGQFLNLPIDPVTLSSMATFSTTILERLKRDRIITDYKDIQVFQDTDEPRMVRIRGRVKPMFHTLYIDVEFVFTTVL